MINLRNTQPPSSDDLFGNVEGSILKIPYVTDEAWKTDSQLSRNAEHDNKTGNRWQLYVWVCEMAPYKTTTFYLTLDKLS